jgi:hypothetical protein
MAIVSRATVTGVLIVDHFRCQGCGAETQEPIATFPYIASASPWIHRKSSRVHFCSPECEAAFYERQHEREREGHQRTKVRSQG